MKDKPKRAVRIWAVVIWLLVWHIASLTIGQEILLVSPVQVIQRLAELIVTQDFWSSIFFSFRRIVAGFFLAVLSGVILAVLSSKFKLIEEFLAPVILTIKATPVASIIILILIWVSSKNLSIIISFLMVLPIIYTNVLDGIRSTDKKLLEMAEVFRVSAFKKIMYIYVSQVLPFFRSACSISLGLCWKSGIAAEVIGIPTGSIGEKLYKAKIYLNTPDLFAWTLTIILISVAFEYLFMLLIRKFISRLERL